MKKLMAGLFTVFAIGVVIASSTTAQASAPSAALTYRWNQPAFQSQVIDLLEMNADGTVRITDWTKARHLLGRDFGWAMEDLRAYNERVSRGVEPRIASIEELSHHAVVLTPEELAYDESREQPAFVMASTAPFCRGGPIGQCDRGNYCCCGGWWFFCTQYCHPCR